MHPIMCKPPNPLSPRHQRFGRPTQLLTPTKGTYTFSVTIYIDPVQSVTIINVLSNSCTPRGETKQALQGTVVND